MLVTVHGSTAVDFVSPTPDDRSALTQRIEAEGLLCTSDNHQLDGFVDHPAEYVNVFHSDAHIANVWSQYFESVEQLRGYLFIHDLVVCTKKG